MLAKKKIAIVAVLLFIIPTTIAFTCGDKICDITETYHSCPQDCPSGSADNYCDKAEDNICDPDCFDQDPDCPGYQEKNILNIKQGEDLINLNNIILIGLFLLIVFVIFILLKKINKQKGISYLNIKQRQDQQQKTKQTSQENLFNKYQYMFKQKNSIRKK